MIRQRFWLPLLFVAVAVACSPKAPAPLQCTSDADCKDLVCNAGGTCVTGAAVDKDKSTIDVDQPKALADGVDVVAVTVTLRDSAGNPLVSRGVQLSVDGSGNKLTQPTLSTNAVGQVTGTLTSTKAETKNITAVAGVVIGQTPGASAVTLSKKATVEFDADSSHLAPPGTGDNQTNFAVTAADGTSAPTVVANGTPPVKIHLVLRDALGNPVSGATVFFTVDGTDITTVPANGQGTTGSDGTFDATIVSHTVQTATVHFVVGSISQNVPITFIPGPADLDKSEFFVGIGTGTPAPCGGSSQPVCAITADGSSGPIAINVHAVDAFGNDAVGAKVYFEWPGSHPGDCDPNNIDPTTCEQGNTFTFPTANIAKGESGLQASPLSAGDGGTFASNITFASNHAEVKHIIVHVDDLAVDLPPITVTAGAPSGVLSMIAAFGNPDGTPVVADTGAGGANYALVAYVSDAFNNPAPNVVIDFSSSGGDSDLITPVDGSAHRCSSSPPFVCREWDDTTTYNIGDLAYSTTDNNAYKSLVADNLNNDPTSPDSSADWELVGAVGGVVTDETGSVAYFLASDTVDVGGDAGKRTVSATTPEITALWSGSSCAVPPNEVTYPCIPQLAVAFGPGPVDSGQSSLSVSPSSVSTDVSPDNVSVITLHLKDQHGNPTPDQGVSLDAFDAPSSGNPCTTCVFTAPSYDPGTATYTADIASTKAQVVYAIATINGAFSTAPGQITFLPGAVSASNSTLAANPGGTSSPLTANGSAIAAFTLTLRDAQNNVIPAVTPSTSISGSGNGGLSAPATDSSGVSNITFNSTVAEGKVVQVTANSVTLTQTGAATFAPGPADSTKSSALSANPTSILDDGINTTTLAVTVKDAQQNVVPSLTVTFSAGHGSFSNSNTAITANTDGNGLATATWKSTTVAAPETLTVSVPVTGGAPFTKTVSVTVSAGAASPTFSTVDSVTSPATTTGVTIGTNVDIGFTEKDGSQQFRASKTFTVVCDPANVTISYPSGQTTSAQGAGTARVTSNVAGQKACQVVDESGTPFLTVNIRFNAGAPDSGKSGAPQVSPPSTVADNSHVINITWTIRDAQGNGVPGKTVILSSTRGSPPDTIVCNSSCLTDSTGTVTGTIKSTKSGSESLGGVVTSTAISTSTGIAFSPGAATQVAFIGAYDPVGNPSGVSVVGGFAMTPINVQLADQFGNLTSSPTPVTISLGINSSGGGTTTGTLSGGLSVATTSVAVFNTVAVNGAALGACDATQQPCRHLVATAPSKGSGTSTVVHVAPVGGSTCVAGSNANCSFNLQAFNPSSNQVLAPGVYNFATINIPAGVTVSSNGYGVLELRASGDVTINGVVDVSGGSGGNAGGQGTNGGGFGGFGGSPAGNSMDNSHASGTGGTAWGGSVQFIAYGGGPFNASLPSYWGLAYGGNGAGSLPGGGGSYGGGGGAGGSAYNTDNASGGGGGGGGRAGGAGGFAGSDGCVQAGGAGGGPNGAPATGCGASALGGGRFASNGCPNSGYAGGNGGIGSSGCTPLAGSGGGGSIGCDAVNDLAIAYNPSPTPSNGYFPTLRPGSGGGGGGNGGDGNGEANSGGGGGGGGGGGALRIVSNTKIALGTSGAIRANGGNGGNGAFSSDDCVDDSGGGGGGGSGGAIFLQAPVLSVPSGAKISAAGGAGGNSGGTATAGPGGAGGMGRIRLSVDAALSGGQAGSFNPPLPSGNANLTPGSAALRSYVAQYPQ